jgi:hypothetical protein
MTYSKINNNHYSNCIFHASNRLLIQHSLTVIPSNSTLPLTNNLTQFIVGANATPFSIKDLRFVHNELNEDILYTLYY